MGTGGVVLQVLRYRIGCFKGKNLRRCCLVDTPRMPKNYPVCYKFTVAGNMPIIKHLTNAKRGYVASDCLGRSYFAPQYRVSPHEVGFFGMEKSKTRSINSQRIGEHWMLTMHPVVMERCVSIYSGCRLDY